MSVMAQRLASEWLYMYSMLYTDGVRYTWPVVLIDNAYSCPGFNRVARETPANDRA